LTNATIKEVTNREMAAGETTQGWLLLNMAGGEILLVEKDHLPEKHRVV
jgi:hypothetical protein